VNIIKVASGVPDALDALAVSEGLIELIYSMMSLVCICSPLVLLYLSFCILIVFVNYNV
jgi:hypothetical protein